jgi:uncharacterized protein YhbP (UPF0306 family)
MGRDEDDSLASRIASLLDAHHVMSLATIGDDGPHAASLFYVRDGYALIWLSDPASRHSRHIGERAEVAATIAGDYSDFADIRGLQVHGRARRIDHAQEQARGRDRLTARYPFLQRLFGADLRHAVERAQLYRLEPERIVLIDNRRGFGSKETLEREALTPTEPPSALGRRPDAG